MRLPRIRLRLPRLSARPRISFEWLGGLVSRTVLLYAGFTLVVFLVGLIVNFPHDIVVRRVMSNVDLSPLQVDFKSARFAWHHGYELRGVRVSQTVAGEDVSWLECSTLDVLPELKGLMRGQFTGVSWQGELYGGTVTGQWTMAGAGGSGQVELSKLELGRYRPLMSQIDEGQITGQVSGNFTVQVPSADRRATQVSGEILVNRPGLLGGKIKGFKIPDLQFAQAKGKLSVKGDRLEIQEFRLVGDQLNGSLSGSIVLRDPAASSQLNLRVTLEPSAATPDAIKGALLLIPRAPGARPDAPITISGTLGAPQIR
ncbi:MAG: type II secretion system protein GspN [Deltaproteobacteria bacterium]|nr:type II secretion system protein GspN [Deltaproteobacteria bacterium]MBI3389955.1 type II secretion system protein GspN [Deltaproteobacteria bacterium]